MAQDTIKCYDSPSDVVQALAEILLLSPTRKSIALKRVLLVLRAGLLLMVY